jgi:hypothetical protein
MNIVSRSFSIDLIKSKFLSSAYTVTLAFRDWPISLLALAISNAFETSVRSSRILFHFSSSFASKYFSFSTGQSFSMTLSASSVDLWGIYCQISSEVKASTGVSIFTSASRISYITLCAALLSRESAFDVYSLSLIISR